MAELLLELLCEDIPARVQETAVATLKHDLTQALATADLPAKTVHTFSTPRRLTVIAQGLAPAQTDRVEEKRGPRVGAPDTAIQGFLRAQGLTSLDQCTIRTIGKQDYHVANIHRPGQATADVLATIIPETLTSLTWSKSMRWDATQTQWIRPVRGLVCILDGQVVPLSWAGLTAGNTTQGHPVHAPQPITVNSGADYKTALTSTHVCLERAQRRTRIIEQATALATARQLSIVEDDRLIDEIVGLVEWPVALMGDFDAAYLDLPEEVLLAALCHQQKYLLVRDKSGALAPHCIIIANVEAEDGGAHIITGNMRVVRARLDDARFFWDQDRKKTLDERVPDLARRIFHAKLGHMGKKARRLSHLAAKLAKFIPDADPVQAQRAGRLAKADLTSQMVAEFPQLQGIIGGYYARHDGEDDAVATAIATHYAPLGSEDACPDQPVAIAVALADRIDTLREFFSIGERPTGSRDPYALRQAASAVLRIIVSANLRLSLSDALTLWNDEDEVTRGVHDLGEFFSERIPQFLRTRGYRHDLIEAVLNSTTGKSDMVDTIARLDALAAFLNTKDGANLLTAYARARNIVAIEQNRDKSWHTEPPDPEQFSQPEEAALFDALEACGKASMTALKQDKFEEAMTILARLRQPVDDFFDKVTVNSDNETLRINRLRMLARITETLNQVAAFNRLEGGSKSPEHTTS